MTSTNWLSFMTVVVGLAMVIGQSAGVADVIPNFEQQIVNGNFEDTSGWTDPGTPLGWEGNAAAYPRNNLADGGTVSMGISQETHPQRHLKQDLGSTGDTVEEKWIFEFDFAADDPGEGVAFFSPPPGGQQTSTFLMFSTGASGGMDIRIYDSATNPDTGEEDKSAGDGDGDFYVYDGSNNNLLLADAVIFDPDVWTDPAGHVHHFKLEAGFDAFNPEFDLTITDSNGLEHSTTSNIFRNGFPAELAFLTRVSIYGPGEEAEDLGDPDDPNDDYHPHFIVDNVSLMAVTEGGQGAPANVLTWNKKDGLGNWAHQGNWSFTGAKPVGYRANNPNHTAVFEDSITGPTTIVTNLPVTINRIEFNNASHSYFIGGGGNINMMANTAPSPIDPSISTMGGTHEFQINVNLYNDTVVNVASSSRLIFDGPLNLMDNTLTKIGSGTMAVNNKVTLNGGTLNATEGTISGVGLIGGNVNNDGATISPGNDVQAGAASVVPEPATFLLLMCALLGLMVGPNRTRRCLAQLPALLILFTATTVPAQTTFVEFGFEQSEGFLGHLGQISGRQISSGEFTTFGLPPLEFRITTNPDLVRSGTQAAWLGLGNRAGGHGFIIKPEIQQAIEDSNSTIRIEHSYYRKELDDTVRFLGYENDCCDPIAAGELFQLEVRQTGDIALERGGGTSTASGIGSFAEGWYDFQVDLNFDAPEEERIQAVRYRLPGANLFLDLLAAPVGFKAGRPMAVKLGGINFRTEGNNGRDSAWDDVKIFEISALDPATVFAWNQDGLGDWANQLNWSITGAPPDADRANNQNHTVVFGDTISGITTPVTNLPVTINRIEFTNTSHSYFIAGGGNINLMANTASSPLNPSISVIGTHEFQVDVNLHADTTVDVASSSSLTFEGALNVMGRTLTKSGPGTLALNNQVTLVGGTLVGIQGTINGDGTIGGNLINEGGTISPGKSANVGVPEPATLLLIFCALLSLATFARTR